MTKPELYTLTVYFDDGTQIVVVNVKETNENLDKGFFRAITPTSEWIVFHSKTKCIKWALQSSEQSPITEEEK